MATPPIELAGVAVVAAGSFNPAIFQPRWFLEKELLTANAEESAHANLVVSPELTAFTADWLSVQITLQQAVFTTVDDGRDVDLRDLARGVFELLPETPVDALGINADAHFRLESEDAWHEIGDAFLPKDLWEPLFEGEDWRRRPGGKAVGLRTLTVEVNREDPVGYVRIEVAPSARITPNGVYAGINSHFQLTIDERRGNGYEAGKVIEAQWEDNRAFERGIIEQFLQIV